MDLGGPRGFRLRHFRERQVEGETGFRSLVLADAVLVQGVTTATGGGIVERFSEIIATEEPFKTTARGAPPVVVLRESKGFQRGRHGGIGFERLLIEAGAFLAAFPKTIAADRRELPGIAL